MQTFPLLFSLKPTKEPFSGLLSPVDHLLTISLIDFCFLMNLDISDLTLRYLSVISCLGWKITDTPALV